MWTELNTKDRWLLVTAGLQAAATIGTFLVAVVGIWKVAPIITYQVQQQEARRTEQPAAAVSAAGSATDRFAADAVSWWGTQVANLQRIIDLTGPAAPGGSKVRFEVIAGGAPGIAPGAAPDLLVVTSTSRGGTSETVQVPVNEHAMPPSQYLQYRINQGVFGALDAATRSKVEIAVQSYIHRQMVPHVAPPHIRPTMSVRQLHEELALDQSQRQEALQHLLGLKALLDTVVRGP